MSKTLEAQILKIVGAVLDVSVEELSLDSSMDDTEEWDSVAMMGIVVALEEELDLYFTEAQLEAMIDMPSIIATIKETLRHE